MSFSFGQNLFNYLLFYFLCILCRPFLNKNLVLLDEFCIFFLYFSNLPLIFLLLETFFSILSSSVSIELCIFQDTLLSNCSFNIVSCSCFTSGVFSKIYQRIRTRVFLRFFPSVWFFFSVGKFGSPLQLYRLSQMLIELW